MTLSLPKKTTTIGKVRLLLWKNFLLQKRHYFQTFFDIILPVIFFILFVLSYAHTKSSSYKRSEQNYSSYSIESLDSFWWVHFTGFSPIDHIKMVFVLILINRSSDS